MTSDLPSRIQDLPPFWARFCLGIERFLLHELALPLRNRHLLLACSAGSDSTALLLILHCLAPRLGLTINVAHLDHGLRPESAQEAGRVAELCRRLNIRLATGRSNVARYAQTTGTGLEQAGRTLRYRFLFGIQRRIDADLLLTAHHADDLAEDVLMRLIRGTGWPGLAGMPCWDPQRGIIRPLLHTPKADLQQFLREIHVTWAEDPSNSHLNHTRNRIRSMVMPMLNAENRRFLSGIIRLHQQGCLDADLFASMLSIPVQQARQSGHFLEAHLLDSIHPAVRLRLYKAMLDELGFGQALHDSLLRLDQAWRRRQTEATLQFPGGKTARVNRTGIRFSPAPSVMETIVPCD